LDGYDNLQRPAITSNPVALDSLRKLVKGSCPACVTYVFNKLGSTQTQYYSFLSLQAEFYDGTKSNAPISYLCGRASGFGGFVNWAWCSTNSGSNTVSQYMAANQSIAVTQTPSTAGQGMMTFFDPEGICKSQASAPSGILNQALIFHESLHGFSGKEDIPLEIIFGINTNPPSNYITYYLEDNIFTGGASTCGN
jgi:hypothetical protein